MKVIINVQVPDTLRKLLYLNIRKMGKLVCFSSDVGPIRRWVIYIIAILESITFGGVIFGFAQLVFVLKSEGIFSNYCDNTTITSDIQVILFRLTISSAFASN